MPEPSKDASITYYALAHIDESEPSAVFREIRDPAVIDDDHPPKSYRTELWKGGTWVDAPSLVMYTLNGEVGAYEITEAQARELISSLPRRR